MGGRFRVGLFAAWLLCCVAGAAPGQEAWHLITEGELRSIEEYKRSCEAEKLNWLLQVSELRALADRLLSESESLNAQLKEQRELNRKLTLSFDEYERDQSRLLSQKDTRISGLETENRRKDAAIARLIIAVSALGIIIAADIAIKIYRMFRLSPV
jgi:hypothetical protein